MKLKVNIIIMACLLIMFASVVHGAFSTPFIPNKTVILNGTDTFEYDIVFQNPENTSTVMKLSILTGREWVEPDEFNVEVRGKQYDATGQFIIKIPDQILVDGEERDLEYNKPYEITYVVSSGDIGGGGMVPVTSQVKKTIYVVVPEEVFPWTLVINIAGMIIIVCAIAVYGYTRMKRQKNEAATSTDSDTENNG